MKIIRWIKKEWGLRKADRLFHKRKPHEALHLIEKMQEDSPLDIDFIIQKAWLLGETRQYNEALNLVLKTLLQFPNHPLLLLIQGEMLYATEKWQEARETLQKALDLSPDNLRIEYSLGLTYVALGEYALAAPLFESSIQYDKTLVQSRLLTMAERFLFEHRPKH